MAQKTSSKSSTRSTGTRSTASRSTSSSRSTAAKKKTSTTAKTRKQVDARIVDAGMRREIWGIVIIAVAVLLFLGVVLTTDGAITKFVSNVLRSAFGIGAFILPIILMVIGVCFLIRFQEFRVPTRVTIGASLIFVAILAILAVSAPGSGEELLKHIFDPEQLTARGGYLGAGIGWVLCTLMGKVLSIVISAAVIIIGLVIMGFSFVGLVDLIREKRAERAEYRAQYREQMAEAGTTRLREDYRGTGRRNQVQNTGVIDPGMGLPAAQPTVALGKGKKGKAAQTDYTAGYVFQDTATGAATTRFADPSGVSVSSAAYGQATLAPATPLPSYEPVKAPAPVAAAPVVEPVSAGTQTATRRLGRKEATDVISGGTVTFEQPIVGNSITIDPAKAKPVPAEPVDPSMTAKLKTAAEEDMEGFELPSMSLLQSTKATANNGAAESAAAKTAQLLEQTFADFNVHLNVVGWVPGPTVTLYKLAIPAGLKVQTINNLSADISRALMVDGVRIYSPVPGTPYVGIEVPNQTRQTVFLADVLKDAPKGALQIAIGKNVDGKAIVADLAKMPHLLIGGTTGSGKSIAMHGFIMSILMRATPSEVRFIMVDPKRVEFNHYEGIPHLYVPPVVEPKEASSALSWAVAEMELRLKKLQKAGARDILSYNAMIDAGELDVENVHKLPYIVIVIDELADLMMNVGKEVEFSISRIAQLARAAGIHLIVATQRPDSNIVTGLIKANITNRIALKVSSGINSSVIIDQRGAENLVGRGDMLFQTTDSPKPSRIQGCYVSDKEIDAVVAELKKQGEPEYNTAILSTNKVGLGDQKTDGFGGEDMDPLLWEAADLVVSNNFASTSTIQRKLSVGYARAGRIMDQLEDKGVVGPPNGSKPRDVLVDVEGLEAIKAFDALD